MTKSPLFLRKYSRKCIVIADQSDYYFVRYFRFCFPSDFNRLFHMKKLEKVRSFFALVLLISFFWNSTTSITLLFLFVFFPMHSSISCLDQSQRSFTLPLIQLLLKLFQFFLFLYVSTRRHM